jgi:hypothetical protein
MNDTDESIANKQEEVALPSYVNPFYKFLAIWGVIVGAGGLLQLTMFLIVLLIQHSGFFDLDGIVLFGVFVLAMSSILFFSLRWLLRYGRYVKLNEQPRWRKK